jgi:hypothetical protein
MNERIRLLADEAGIYKLNLSDETEYWIMEKFAELIVRECAQEAYDCAKQFRNDEHYRVDNLWPQFERVCNAVGDDIKIKFGVEE